MAIFATLIIIQNDKLTFSLCIFLTAQVFAHQNFIFGGPLLMLKANGSFCDVCNKHHVGVYHFRF
jgi:hypothetical protein